MEATGRTVLCACSAFCLLFILTGECGFVLSCHDRTLYSSCQCCVGVVMAAAVVTVFAWLVETEGRAEEVFMVYSNKNVHSHR